MLGFNGNRLPLTVVNAFITETPFSGNPAAVVLLEAWPEDALLAAMANQHNLSETAFIVPTEDFFALRWFTPTQEVTLCGHATMAAACALVDWGCADSHVVFSTASGVLEAQVYTDSESLECEITLPSPTIAPVPVPAGLEAALGVPILACATTASAPWQLICELSRASEVAELNPDMVALSDATPHCVIATAKGGDTDIVSRFFGPQVGVPEDPVTGSAHTLLYPYWASKLGKTVLSARQLSRRGGLLTLTPDTAAVRLTGACQIYSRGRIDLP
jgi:PhzF family phenazine biosynthesis protein